MSEFPPDDRTVVVTRPATAAPVAAPPPASPPKKTGRLVLASCGGCLLIVLLGGGIGAFVAMRGKGTSALPFFNGSQATVHGTVFNSAGTPSGEHVRITVHATQGGSSKTFTTDASKEGHYSLKVPEGPCTIEAAGIMSVSGQNWTIPLMPSSGVTGTVPCKGDQTRDFRWQLTGSRPAGSPLSSSDHLGAFVSIAWNPNIPADSQIVVHLAPSSPMIDGTPGSPMDLGPLAGDMASPVQKEIPVASWVVTAVSGSAAGVQPLLVDGLPQKTLDFPAAGQGRTLPVTLSEAPAAAVLPEAIPPAATPQTTPPPAVQASRPAPKKARPKAPAPKAEAAAPPSTSSPAVTRTETVEKSHAEEAPADDDKSTGFKGKLHAFRDKFRRHPKKEPDAKPPR